MTSFAYPYPVLGGGDSIDGSFDVSFNLFRTKKRTVIIKVIELSITNLEFKSMLKANECKVVLRIYCGSTFYSESFEIRETSQIELPEYNLVNRCEAEVFIVMNSNKSYSLKSFKDEYHGLSFNLKKNDIIGVTGTLKWDVPRFYEKMVSNSIFKFIMRVKESEDVDKDLVCYNFSNDEIYVTYPFHEEIDPLSSLFKKKKYTAYWATIIPALSEGYRIILSRDADEREEFQDFRWFHYLEKVKENYGIVDDEPYKVAQKVFVTEAFIKMFDELSRNK